MTVLWGVPNYLLVTTRTWRVNFNNRLQPFLSAWAANITAKPAVISVLSTATCVQCLCLHDSVHCTVLTMPINRRKTSQNFNLFSKHGDDSSWMPLRPGRWGTLKSKNTSRLPVVSTKPRYKIKPKRLVLTRNKKNPIHCHIGISPSHWTQIICVHFQI